MRLQITVETDGSESPHKVLHELAENLQTIFETLESLPIDDTLYSKAGDDMGTLKIEVEL